MFHALLLMAVSILPSLGTFPSNVPCTNVCQCTGSLRTHRKGACRGWTGAAAFPESSSGFTSWAVGAKVLVSASQQVHVDTDTVMGCAAWVLLWHKHGNTSLFSYTDLPHLLSCLPQSYCSMFSASSGNLTNTALMRVVEPSFLYGATIENFHSYIHSPI